MTGVQTCALPIYAAADDAGRDECVRLCRMDDGDERVGVVLVAQDAADVGHGDEALRAELTRDARGRGVGVDVVDVPLRVAPDGGHDRDVALVALPNNDGSTG